MSDAPTPPGWYPDPAGRFEHRWWDGRAWTEHVATAGQQSTDAPSAPPGPPRTYADEHVPVGTTRPDKVERQVAKATGGTGAAGSGGGTIFTEPVLVVNQKAKVIELTNQYAVYDARGTQLAGVQQVGQSAARKVLRLVSNVDQFLTHKIEIKDLSGAVLLSLTRPAKVFKSTVIVSGPSGDEIGRIVQENMIGKINFGLEAGGVRHGSIRAENWRAWNFAILDTTGVEVARITKTWEGLAKAMFTTADNYVLEIHHPLQDPLRSLVVAAALGIDTALKQDDKG